MNLVDFLVFSFTGLNSNSLKNRNCLWKKKAWN